MSNGYHHGVRVVEVNEGTRPIRTVSTAVIGLIATADDADAATFPLDTPVMLTNVNAVLGKAGTSGTLKQALTAIGLQTKPLTIVVRVAEGSGSTAEDKLNSQTANVVGGVSQDGKYKGIKALLAAQAKFGVKPRILGAPGLDTLPVANALVAAAQSMRSFAYVSAWDCANKEDAIQYRDEFGQREIMVIWPNFIAFDSVEEDNIEIPAVAYALGLRAKLDQEVGWHKTISNMVINGPVGLSKDVFWDLQDPATDAGLLNASEVTTLINRSGYRFWGSRTCEAPGGFFSFENYTRTAHVLADSIAEAMFSIVDGALTPAMAKDIIESVNAKFRELKGRYIVDGQAWLDPEINTKETLKAGQLTIDYDYTPIPPLENLNFQQRITDRYLEDFAARVNS